MFCACWFRPIFYPVCFSLVGFNALRGYPVSEETDFCAKEFCFFGIYEQFVI
jgi:hypothetical protein